VLSLVEIKLRWHGDCTFLVALTSLNILDLIAYPTCHPPKQPARTRNWRADSDIGTGAPHLTIIFDPDVNGFEAPTKKECLAPLSGTRFSIWNPMQAGSILSRLFSGSNKNDFGKARAQKEW
jgi:hypothetical protein